MKSGACGSLICRKLASHFVATDMQTSSCPGWTNASRRRRDRKLAEWLKRLHLDRAEYGAALPMAEFLFEFDPGVAEYLEFRDLAVKAGKWDRNRPRALIKFMSPADGRPTCRRLL